MNELKKLEERQKELIEAVAALRTELRDIEANIAHALSFQFIGKRINDRNRDIEVTGCNYGYRYGDKHKLNFVGVRVLKGGILSKTVMDLWFYKPESK